jgi:hypothetical protein
MMLRFTRRACTLRVLKHPSCSPEKRVQRLTLNPIRLFLRHHCSS